MRILAKIFAYKLIVFVLIYEHQNKPYMITREYDYEKQTFQPPDKPLDIEEPDLLKMGFAYIIHDKLSENKTYRKLMGMFMSVCYPIIEQKHPEQIINLYNTFIKQILEYKKQNHEGVIFLRLNATEYEYGIQYLVTGHRYNEKWQRIQIGLMNMYGTENWMDLTNVAIGC
jgi:hypothetical protein